MILLVMIGMMLASGIAGGIISVMIDRWRRENHQLATDIAEYEKRGRHAKTQPRTSLELARRPLPQEKKRGAAQIPSRSYAEWMVQRMAAAHTMLPEPGKYQPQPGRDSGPGTVTFARLDKPATTGEMAAVTDQFLADMAVQEEQFRLGLAT